MTKPDPDGIDAATQAGFRAGLRDGLQERINESEVQRVADSIASIGERVHVIGKDDRLNLSDMKGGSLHTLKKSDLEHILRRPITLDSQSRPALSDDDKSLIGIALELQQILVNNPRLDKEAKQRVLESMRNLGRYTTREQFLRRAERTIIGEEATTDLTAWANGPLTLQRPDGSAFHKMKGAWQQGDVCLPIVDPDPGLKSLFDAEHHSFVIEHDWASAFAGAHDFDGGEIRLPFDMCCFEYRISNRRVIAAFYQKLDGPQDTGCVPVVQSSTSSWVMPWMYLYENGSMRLSSKTDRARQHTAHNPFLIAFQKVADLIGRSVRAVSISLDAKVAETEIIRAPHRLNSAREKRGKLPLLDYHVVSLARRSRPAPLPRDPNAEPGTRKRLHFRRGHWRHYEAHKTWINWMLVGNPDLGFIDKEYRL